jgi:hypothetical protein
MLCGADGFFIMVKIEAELEFLALQEWAANN